MVVGIVSINNQVVNIATVGPPDTEVLKTELTSIIVEGEASVTFADLLVTYVLYRIDKFSAVFGSFGLSTKELHTIMLCPSLLASASMSFVHTSPLHQD